MIDLCSGGSGTAVQVVHLALAQAKFQTRTVHDIKMKIDDAQHICGLSSQSLAVLVVPGLPCHLVHRFFILLQHPVVVSVRACTQ